MKLDFEKLTDWEALIEIGVPIAINIIAAILIFFIGKWVVRRLVNLVKAGMTKSRMDNILVEFLGTVLYGLGLALVIIAALGELGVNTTSAAAIVGGASLAIGLSLQDQLKSFAAGVMLIIFRPFRQGDFIEGAGVSGIVEKINIVNTEMRTPNNQHVIVPNAQIWGSIITNYSTKPTRRIDMTVGVSYDADLKQTRSVLEACIAREGRVLDNPECVIAVKELADSSVNFVVRPWVKTSEYWDVMWALNEDIKNSLDAADIGIPYPQMDVHFDKPEAA